MLTTHETNRMRAAWNDGYADAMAGAAKRSARYTGRDRRNYDDGYLCGVLDRGRA